MDVLVWCDRSTSIVSPERSLGTRGSFMSSHAKMVDSSLYATPVNVLTLVRSVCFRHTLANDTTYILLHINGNIRWYTDVKYELNLP
jgi:hypothetical protein